MKKKIKVVFSLFIIICLGLTSFIELTQAENQMPFDYDLEKTKVSDELVTLHLSITKNEEVDIVSITLPDQNICQASELLENENYIVNFDTYKNQQYSFIVTYNKKDNTGNQTEKLSIDVDDFDKKEKNEIKQNNEQVNEPVVISTIQKPTTFDELSTVLSSAEDNDIIDLSQLSSDGNNHSLNVNQDLVFKGNGNTIEGLLITVAANKTLTLRNITIQGYSVNSYAMATVQGKDGNLIVERDACLIGSSKRHRNFNYQAGYAIYQLKNVRIEGKVKSGSGAGKIEGGAIFDCYKVVVDGGVVEGSTIAAGATHGSANGALISNVNYLETKNARLIGCIDITDDQGDGGQILDYIYYASLIDTHIQTAQVTYPYGVVSLSNSRMGHSYERDSACGLVVKGTNLIAPESIDDTSSNVARYYESGQAGYSLTSAITFDMNGNIIDEYDSISPIIDIGENVIVQGGNTTLGSASTAIVTFSSSVPVIVKLHKGARVIGGSTTDTSDNAYGGYGIVGAQVNADDALIQGGKGTFGGYGISRCWVDSQLNGSTKVIGGEGYKVGGHAVYNAGQITINGALITGGKAPTYIDETQRAGAAVYSVDTLILNDGQLSPGQGGYTTCCVKNVYMKNGVIYNSGGAIEPQANAPYKPAIELYGAPILQLAGGQIGYMNYVSEGITTKYLAIWKSSSSSHWLYRKENKNGQWKDKVFGGYGKQVYADEVISDGQNITDTKDLDVTSNIYCQSYQENRTELGNILIYDNEDVTVTFPRAITANDDIIISARNWDKETAPYEPLNNIDVQYITDGRDGKITFKQPQRSIRIELRKKGYVVNKAENKVVGINQTYKVGDTISFETIGATLNGQTDGLNDTRYVPVSWKVNTRIAMSRARNTQSFIATKPGHYILTVEFAEEQYFQENQWIRTGTTDQKTVEFTVEDKSVNPDKPNEKPNIPDQKPDFPNSEPEINNKPNIQDKPSIDIVETPSQSTMQSKDKTQTADTVDVSLWVGMLAISVLTVLSMKKRIKISNH